MTKEEKRELQKLINEINEEAKNVVEDYANNPSELSGSTVQIHETSPYLNKELKGEGWKKVLKSSDMEGLLKKVQEHNKKLGKKKNN